MLSAGSLWSCAVVYDPQADLESELLSRWYAGGTSDAIGKDDVSVLSDHMKSAC